MLITLLKAEFLHFKVLKQYFFVMLRYACELTQKFTQFEDSFTCFDVQQALNRK